MVMMNDEQRARDVLAGVGGSAAMNRAETSGVAAPETDSDVPETDAEPEDQDDGDADEPKSRWSFLTEMVVLFTVALTIALLIKTFVVQPFYIPSGSMENTLLIGDKVLVNKVVFDIRPVGRGDIVVFSGAGSWDGPGAAPARNRGSLVSLYDDTIGRLVSSVESLA